MLAAFQAEGITDVVAACTEVPVAVGAREVRQRYNITLHDSLRLLAEAQSEALAAAVAAHAS